MKWMNFVSFLLLLCLLSSCGNAPKENAPSEVTPERVESQSPILPLPKSQRLESGKLLPLDEGQLSPDFLRFRKELLTAIERKDLSFIHQIIVDNIQIGFDDDNNRAAFLKMWDLEGNREKSEFWQQLKKVLLLGGTFDRQQENGFIAPYLSATWPEGLEPFDYVVITGEEVRVRNRPDLASEAIAALSYDVVALAPTTEAAPTTEIDGETWPWIKIILPNNTQKGYVYGKYVHGPVGYRAYFERQDGKWKMRSFLAGD